MVTETVGQACVRHFAGQPSLVNNVQLCLQQHLALVVFPTKNSRKNYNFSFYKINYTLVVPQRNTLLNSHTRIADDNPGKILQRSTCYVCLQRCRPALWLRRPW